MPDITLVLLFGLLAVMIFFTWRNSRKRKADAETMQSKLQPGAEVMTQHGIFGTLISLDDEKNEAVIETTPGTRLRVHRQTISRVVDPTELEHQDEDIVQDDDVVDELDSVNEEPAETPADTSEPEFGERVEKPKRTPKKTAE